LGRPMSPSVRGWSASPSRRENKPMTPEEEDAQSESVRTDLAKAYAH
jgi:hypothetical protein